MPMLDPRADVVALSEAIERYTAGTITLEHLRAVADQIFDRWHHADSATKPALTVAEVPLWNAVWEITSSCAESLTPDLVARHLPYLSGKSPLPRGTSALRP